ncbi:MAG: ATP-binding protein [Mariniblastus sp.]
MTSLSEAIERLSGSKSKSPGVEHSAGENRNSENRAGANKAGDNLEAEYSSVLLDLSLPDSPIHETLGRIVTQFPDVPVIVLTSLNDLDFAAKAVQQGAQDYLVKTDLSSEVLERAIRYAIERKRTQVELQVYAAKLEESNRHLESFAHTLAHEIRSPLTVVSGCLQLVDDMSADKIDASTRETLADSLQAIMGITDLVEELLEFSQANSRSADEFETVDLEVVFYHVYSVLRPELKQANATITHDPLPAIAGNELQLRHLLQNLIGNAIKYRGEAPLQIHVGCEASESHWTFHVADNGKGIADADQEKIFRAFTRLESASDVSGVGIGLAFCQRIAENHDGQIWVASQLGIGSKFFFALPTASAKTQVQRP